MSRKKIYRKKINGHDSVEYLFDCVVRPDTSAEMAGTFGRNLWRRGLRMVTIRRRIEREELEAKERGRNSLSQPYYRKTLSRRQINNIKRNKYA